MRQETDEEIRLTDKEKRLTLRRRKTWHKVLRRTWYVLSALAVFAIIFVPTIMFLEAQKELAYQNTVEAIQAVPRTGSQPTFFIPADLFTQPYIPKTEEGRLAAFFADAFVYKADSLGLTVDQRLGGDLSITFVPCGLFGKRHVASQMNLYTGSCDCNSVYDETVLQFDSIDSTGIKAIVISSQKVTMASIQP
jgi:hypothetical protein